MVWVFRFGWFWFCVGFVWWVWLARAGDVVEFLVEESRLRRLSGGVLERVLGLARAVSDFEGLFFEDGVECLGYYVVWWGGSYRVYVVVAYLSGEPVIEVVDVEEWVAVSRAKRLAARG